MDGTDTPAMSVIPAPAPAPAPTPPSAHRSILRWAPLAVAVAFYVAFAIVVLTRPERMIEPDPYAYRASIVALQDGNVTLTQEQYDALSQRLQQTELGGGISQWRQRSDGAWVSEKNPGYPFLAVGFDAASAIRLAPLFYGALAAIGLWFGGRAWTSRRRGRWAALAGEWGGTFAVAAFFSCALAMVMAWRSTMPTFTDASLVACGLGLLVWSAVAFERSRRARTIVGALAFLSFGLAFFVRYTNVVVLAVAGLAALWVCLRPRWGLGWRTLVWWALAAIPPVIAALAYDAMVFDGPFSTGYRATDVQFSTSAISDNLSIMPKRLLQAMPIWVVGIAAIVVLVGIQIADTMTARRRSNDSDGSTPVDAPAPAAEHPTDRAIDLWVGTLLVATWGGIWGLYAAYEWTARLFGGGGGPMGMGDGGQPVYSTVRFYLPALGAIALLAAWVLTRVPAVLGLLVLVALFALGVHEFVDTTNSRWAHMQIGGGGQFPGGGRFPDGGPMPGDDQFPGGAAPSSRPG